MNQEIENSTYESSLRFRGKANRVTETLLNQASVQYIKRVKLQNFIIRSFPYFSSSGTGLISIGTSGKTSTVNFDTDSTDLWVPSVQYLSDCSE